MSAAEPGLFAVVRVSWSSPIGGSPDDPLSSLFVRMPRNPADSDSPSEWLWWQPDDAAGWTWDELHDRAAAVEVVRFGGTTADPQTDRSEVTMNTDLARALCELVLNQTRMEPSEPWTATEVVAFADGVLQHLGGPGVLPELKAGR